MDVGKTINTVGLFAGGAFFISKSIVDVAKYSTFASPTALLATGAILFPLALSIWTATEKIFDALGWESCDARNITNFIFTGVSSTMLASAAAVGLGLTTSMATGWIVNLIALQMILGISSIVLGIDNISSDLNHKPFIYG
jgi:hypothetical protein